MGKFVINGRKPVSGVHRVPGNKNAALPMIAAAMLADGPVTLEEVPDIADVATMLEIAAALGADVSRDRAARTATIHAARIRRTSLPPELAARIRTSVLFAGPLLARCGSVSMPHPGGDGIGRRRIDTHFAGLAAMGARLPRSGRTYSLKAQALHGAEMVLDEASVTATENILCAAAATEGRTVIYNAACEPHVQDLCRMLSAMGAGIEGAGTNRLIVEGRAALHGCTARVGSDTIEAASYMAAALATGGDLTLENVDPAAFSILERHFRRFGVRWQLDAGKRTLRVPRQRLSMEYDLGDAIPSLADGPWPMFPSDLVSVFIVLATQARGTCLFFEKMFESRMYFVDHLIGMGAKIVACDPHRVVVTGPTRLQGSTVTSPDIRAGMALIIAALCAKGRTEIYNAGSIDRGYASVDKELSALGADIVRED